MNGRYKPGIYQIDDGTPAGMTLQVSRIGTAWLCVQVNGGGTPIACGTILTRRDWEQMTPASLTTSSINRAGINQAGAPDSDGHFLPHP